MRVLVLRPEAQARASAARLAATGHDPLVAPVLSIERTGTPAPAGDFAAVLVTSANAAPALFSLKQASDLPVFAVGRRTAAMLDEMGCGPTVGAPDGASLARLVAEQLAPARLLLIAGRDRKGEPEASLARLGCQVVVWEAYHAIAAPNLPEPAREALAGGDLDAVLHYSRRSAETALTLVTAAGLHADFAVLRHLCLSDDVAEGLSALSGATVKVADRPDEDALLALLDTFAPARIGGSLTPQS
jgi:uroporphyrinogen-III synthase